MRPGIFARLRAASFSSPARKAAVCIASILALALLPSSSAASQSFWSAGEAGALALLERLGPEERIAQLLMLSYRGDTPDEGLLRWITSHGLGGIKIFGWNADSSDKVAQAVRSLQQAALASRVSIPLLVATDQEGGWIRHVKGKTSITPGNMAIGASARPWDAYWSAYYIARELKALGINMNFAPTVDLATDLDSFIIGPRAFSDDPVVAGTLAIAFYRGTRDAGVIATAKHFPGHGATSLDSHGTLPRIDADMATLWSRELVPYRMLLPEGLPAIMSGHLAFPLLGHEKRPASLSTYFLRDLLRGKMGFSGVIVTDDVNMYGATSIYGSLAETVYRAILAGNDIVEMSVDVREGDATWNRLTAAYRDDAEFRRRVDESALRVLELKLSYLSAEGRAGVMPSDDLSARVPDPEAAAFFFEMACRSATAVKPASLAPSLGPKVLLAGQFPRFFTAGRATYPGAGEYRFGYDLTGSGRDADTAGLLSAAKGYDHVVVCVADARSRAMLAALRGTGKKVYAISVLSPALLRGSLWVDGAIAVYSYSDYSIDAGFAALSGQIAPDGRLPVRLE
jgi:beta-N-acetylhexosaminidase